MFGVNLTGVICIDKAFADKLGVPFLEASAKEATNVEEAFLTMAKELIEIRCVMPQNHAVITPLNHASQSRLSITPCNHALQSRLTITPCNTGHRWASR
jgi:hypothetical protein